MLIYGTISLLAACSLPNFSQQTASVEQCPSSPEALPTETIQAEVEGRRFWFTRFDYDPEEIVLDDHTVQFLAREYDFVYCRADGNWTVQPGTLRETFVADLAVRIDTRDEFKPLEFGGQSYQYRVVGNPEQADGADYDTVVFELLLPGENTPQQHLLYTFEQVIGPARRPGIGQLGLPRITTAVTYGDRLWWTVAFEQGEGHNGIATIVSYDPATDETTLLQPPEIQSQQILALAFTGDPEHPTLWMGVKVSSEGARDLPASGLVAYRPEAEDLTSGTLTSFTPQNSPLVGTIPTQIAVDGDKLWAGTRNGVCQFDWQTPEVVESWDCWRFTAEAALPQDEDLPVYPSRLNDTPTITLSSETAGDAVEVLWWLVTDGESQQGRYEIRLDEGLVTTVGQGASPILAPRWIEIAGKVPLFWPGYDWHWRGDRFVRPLDGGTDLWIGGDRGIGPLERAITLPDWYAIRGDLDLIELSAETTQVRYYSGWVDDTLLNPLPTVVASSRPDVMQPNPLVEIDRQLRRLTDPASNNSDRTP